YIVMELMKHPLSEIIERVTLDHKTLSFFIYQILCGVNHLHRHGIIHRDLEPSNIAVNEISEVKVLDFGLARLVDSTAPERMSPYVCTRFYRAPELVLGLPYSEKVDVWSIGCIFAEMITGKVLFTGRDRIHQWNKIVEILGTPTDSFISHLTPEVEKNVRAMPPRDPMPLDEIIPDHLFHGKDEHVHWTAFNARRLISKMLQIDPNDRCSIAEALRDPYVMNWLDEKEV
ncbi:hypothetical protein PENTCL1PPCAC_21798, partial [Pristionchus entomophagus]